MRSRRLPSRTRAPGPPGRWTLQPRSSSSGADPCTAWLGDAVVTDDDGFIVTGDALALSHLDPAGDGRQRAPFPLETSRPGVFAVGDVRSGSIKRVASA